MLRLKQLRLAKPLTQQALGDLVGVTYAEIGRWENEERSIPSHRIPALAKALDVHPGEIFAELPRSSLSGYQRRAAEIAAKLPAATLALWLQMGEQHLPKDGNHDRERRRRSTLRS